MSFQDLDKSWSEFLQELADETGLCLYLVRETDLAFLVGSPKDCAIPKNLSQWDSCLQFYRNILSNRSNGTEVCPGERKATVTPLPDGKCCLILDASEDDTRSRRLSTLLQQSAMLAHSEGDQYSEGLQSSIFQTQQLLEQELRARLLSVEQVLGLELQLLKLWWQASGVWLVANIGKTTRFYGRGRYIDKLDAIWGNALVQGKLENPWHWWRRVLGAEDLAFLEEHRALVIPLNGEYPGYLGGLDPGPDRGIEGITSAFLRHLRVLLDLHQLQLQYPLPEVLDNLPEPVLLTNSRGEILYWNNCGAEITGAACLGQKIEAVAGGLGAWFASLDHSPAEINCSVQRRNFVVRISPIKDIKGEVGVRLDFNRAESGAYQTGLINTDRLSLVGEMAAGFAHEVKNALTTARGSLQLASANQDLTKIQDYLAWTVNELDRANLIVTNYLALAKPMELTKEPVDLAGLMGEILYLIEGEALNNNVKVEVNIDPNLPKLNLDANQIKQVILNLGKNALEVMPQGGYLSFKVDQRNEKEICLEVRDTGPGISPDELNRIFEPFYTTKPKGTGLGLAICRQIVNEHRGRMEVETNLEQGTAFKVFLPIT